MCGWRKFGMWWCVGVFAEWIMWEGCLRWVWWRIAGGRARLKYYHTRTNHVKAMTTLLQSYRKTLKLTSTTTYGRPSSLPTHRLEKKNYNLVNTGKSIQKKLSQFFSNLISGRSMHKMPQSTIDRKQVLVIHRWKRSSNFRDSVESGRMDSGQVSTIVWNRKESLMNFIRTKPVQASLEFSLQNQERYNRGQKHTKD